MRIRMVILFLMLFSFCAFPSDIVTVENTTISVVSEGQTGATGPQGPAGDSDSVFVKTTVDTADVDVFIFGSDTIDYFFNPSDSLTKWITKTQLGDSSSTWRGLITAAGHSQEEIEDYAGAMWAGNTETRCTVTYQDADGTIDIVVEDMNDDVPDSGDLGIIDTEAEFESELFAVYTPSDFTISNYLLASDTSNHRHNYLKASDGNPYDAVSVDADGNVAIDYGGLTITADGLAATSVNKITLQNTTDATVGVPVQVSPGFGLHDEVWDTDGSNDYYDWSVYSKGTSGATTTSTLYFDVGKNGAASANKMSLSSGGALNCVGTLTTGNDALNIDGQLNFVSAGGATGNLLYNDSDQLTLNNSAGMVSTGYYRGTYFYSTTGLFTKATSGGNTMLSHNVGDGNVYIDITAYAGEDGEVRLGDTETEREYTTIDSLGVLHTPKILVDGQGGSSIGIKVDGNKTTGDLFQLTNRDDGATTGDSTLFVDAKGIINAFGIYGHDMNGETIRALQINNSGEFGYDSSTRKSKENIRPIESSDWIYSIVPVTYNSKSTGKERDGLIAEELADVTAKYWFPDENGDPAGINYDKLVVPLIAEIQKLKKEVEALKAERMR